MKTHQRVLLVDVATKLYRVDRYPVGEPFFGPVDLGLHLASRFNSLNIGAGLLAGSIIPGSNRLVINGFSPCWGGFYISTMGGAALVFNNLGLNLLAISGRAATPSVLILNRQGGEHIEVGIEPIEAVRVWAEAPGGVYSMMDHVLERFGDRYANDPRVLAVGPAAAATDCGAIGSAAVQRGKLSYADTWAGRGGFGSKLFQQHNLAAVIFGGTFVADDFRDRKLADSWFQDKYDKTLKAVDFEATTKYRFDQESRPAAPSGSITPLSGGESSISTTAASSTARRTASPCTRNSSPTTTSSSSTRSDPDETAGDVRRALRRGLQKYATATRRTTSPTRRWVRSPVFDQRAAEELTTTRTCAEGSTRLDRRGRLVADGVSCGGPPRAQELGVSGRPAFLRGFRRRGRFGTVPGSASSCSTRLSPAGAGRLGDGARAALPGGWRATRASRFSTGSFTLRSRRGWMVPNQYWTPGVLSPMPIVGKYFMYYGTDFCAQAAAATPSR